jgi:hypothetical protein
MHLAQCAEGLGFAPLIAQRPCDLERLLEATFGLRPVISFAMSVPYVAQSNHLGLPVPDGASVCEMTFEDLERKLGLPGF